MSNYSFDVQALLAPPDILCAKRVLCIQPHPDDNEIGMGGTMAYLADAGCEIHVLTITDGAQGNRDHTASLEQTIKTRREETEKAGRHLGVKHFYYLNEGDGTLNDIVGLSEKIAGVIRQAQPEVIFCPDPWLSYEGHYDHIVTGRAASNAFHMSHRRHFPQSEFAPWDAKAIAYYFTAQPNTVVDITPFMEKKFEAIALHDSQMTPETLAMYRIYFGMKAAELAQNCGFQLGEGFKALSALHTHCFVDAIHI
jgi:Uncharacterized proteins, LmbE homologs